jgi:uncharacterized protein (DUF1330 family)
MQVLPESSVGVYVVAQIRIHDREAYGRYELGFMEIFAQYGGEMLAVDEAPVTLEGQWDHTRTVIIRFASSADARAWYDSDAYQDLAQHRWDGSAADIAIVAGLPPESIERL